MILDLIKKASSACRYLYVNEITSIPSSFNSYMTSLILFLVPRSRMNVDITQFQLISSDWMLFAVIISDRFSGKSNWSSTTRWK